MYVMKILPPKPKSQTVSVRLKEKLKVKGLLFLFHLTGGKILPYTVLHTLYQR